MKLIPRRKKPSRVDQQLAEFDKEVAHVRLMEAMAEIQPPVRYRYLRTRAGRIRHLVPLEPPGSGSLCGWPGADVEADPLLPLCRLCEGVANGISSEGRAAS